jgi:DNA polymerase-4
LAWGQDDRKVTTERETKSISAETTFDTDLRAFEDLEPVLWRLSEKVSKRLKAANLAGQSVTLKLKDSEFRLLTRTRSGLAPTQLAIRLFEPARQLLKAACDGTPFRLIGIGASDLCDATGADRGDLADRSVVRQAQMEAAIDKIRDKFGSAALQKGIAFRRPQR